MDDAFVLFVDDVFVVEDPPGPETSLQVTWPYQAG
jgi:hypothetical protein